MDEIKEILDNAIRSNRAGNVGPVLRRRAHDFSALLERSSIRARLVTTAYSARPTESSSPRVKNFAARLRKAGLRYAYLQFDGIGNDANSHRQVATSST
jgi:hypothetical protein